MEKAQSHNLWLLIPGIGLILTSFYIPLSYLYNQLYWKETEAFITDRIERDDGVKVRVFYVMNFTDAQGTVHRIEASSRDTFMKGKDEDHVRIYYDPSNPPNFELVNHGRYLLLLFFPLGLLACYFGYQR